MTGTLSTGVDEEGRVCLATKPSCRISNLFGDRTPSVFLRGLDLSRREVSLQEVEDTSTGEFRLGMGVGSLSKMLLGEVSITGGRDFSTAREADERETGRLGWRVPFCVESDTTE